MIRFAEAEKFPTNPGSPLHTLYSAKVDDDGSVYLTKVGEENTDDMIQAAKDSTDIATIVAYYNQTGDESVLNRMVPHYGDLTVLPKSMADFLQLRIDSENFFNALPTDIKKQFDNDKDKFFAQAGSEDWYKILDPIVNPGDESAVPNVVSEVNADA